MATIPLLFLKLLVIYRNLISEKQKKKPRGAFLSGNKLNRECNRMKYIHEKTLRHIEMDMNVIANIDKYIELAYITCISYSYIRAS
jgi:hypothetical protein